MRTRITRSDGINWMHYAVIRINDDNMTIETLKTWRSHKYECRGRHPKQAITTTRINSGFDISRWEDDGKPGGLNGLRENYTYEPYVFCYGKKYLMV